jgi:hypothetical protein
MAETVKIDIFADSSSIKELKQQLLEARNQLSGLDKDSEGFQNVARRAGELKDQIKDVNEQVAIFASGSKFEQAGIALGQVKDNLMNLDFEGAAEKARSLTAIVKTISFGEATKGLKDLGSTFLSLGKALLTNPLFLIPAAIIAVLQALGLLKPIIEAITGVFKFLGDAVNSFLVSLGLVAETEKDTTEETKKLNDALKTQEENVNALNASYAEYRALQSTGAELDVRKQIIAAENTLTDILRNRPKDFEAIKNAQITINNLNEKLVKEQTKARLAAFDEQRLIDKERIDSINAELAANNGANDAEKARAKEIFDERQKLINAQLTLDVKRENIVKEGEVNLFKIQTDNSNKIQDINKKASDAKIEAYNKEQEALKKANETELKLLNQVDTNKRKAAEDFAMILENLQEQIFQSTLSDQQKEVQAIEDKYFELETLAGEDIEAQKIIAQAKATELAAIDDKYRKTKSEKDKEAAELELKLNRDIAKTKMDIANGAVDFLNSLNSKNKGILLAALAIEKASAIANVIISAQQEIAGHAANAAANPANAVTGGGAFIAQLSTLTALTKVRAALSIATIAATGFNSAKNIVTSGGGGGAGTVNPGSVTTPAQPSFQLFGQANEGNVTQASGDNKNQTINVNATVSVEQITDTQKKLAQINQSKTL